MSHTQAPQHERNQRCHQSLSLNDMMMEVMECLPESWRTRNEIPNIDLSFSALTEVQTSFTFSPEEDVSDDTLTNLEVREDTQMEDYLIETSDECEVFPIEPEIVIALNEGEDEMNSYVNSEKPEMPQIESKEDQPLVLVRPPTLPCTYGTPYKGVEVRERLQIFYTADTFVLDDPDTIDFFVLEVPDELLHLKEGMHASLPNYVMEGWSAEFCSNRMSDVSNSQRNIPANQTTPRQRRHSAGPIRRCHAYAASAPQANHHASVAVDLPRDARQFKLPELRSRVARFSEPRG
ncbi:hypothetical protein Syun_014115 [Stephania yunnanensis]|uniref:Uncharacterized protein n=1 Tax=Stephania yunnanensis TaxID=152371 RepID=A0AAP0PBH3_9MAGN